MELFLQIVLAVVLVLAAAVLIGWWAFKRWLRGKVGDFRHVAQLLDDRYERPARLRLVIAKAVEPGPALLELWTQAHGMGFSLLADLAGRDDEPALLRVAVHAEQPFGLLLSEADEHAQFAVFALAEDQRLSAFSNGPGESLEDGTLQWNVVAGLTLDSALECLVEQVAERSLKALDLALIRRIAEKAYARRMDHLLAAPPQLAQLRSRAQAQHLQLSEAQIEQAWRIERGQWQGRLAEAVTDQFQALSRISASEWERLRDDVQVVHQHLQDEEVHDLLVDDTPSEQMFEQLLEQGFRGLALFRELNARLPASQQLRELGEVRLPLLAWLFVRNSETTAANDLRQHRYQAEDADGREVHGAVIATTSQDAKQQMARMGLQQVQILNEAPLDEVPEFMLDPEVSAMASRSAKEGLGMALLRSLRGNVWLWAPPAALSLWAVAEGTPYGWADYLVFAYLALALLVLMFFIAPMVLYNQLLQSRLHARWGSAAFCLALLRRLNPLGAIAPHQLELEELKVMIGRGQTAAALKRWQSWQPRLDQEKYLTGLLQLHDAAGDLDATIAAQRELMAISGQEMVKVDLAMALARKPDAADEVEDLLAGLDPAGLSELALAGYHFARGLLLGSRGQYNLAIRQLGQSAERAAVFKGNPLVHGLLAEINGYAALMFKRSGDLVRAEQVWRQVQPLLAKHASCRPLLEAYDRAGGG